MSILVDKNTRVITHGLTGKAGGFHSAQCIEYGTKVVGGVVPGKGGQKSEHGLPVFNTVAAAVKETGANCSMLFVPPPFAADSAMEAAAAGVKVIVLITEGVPTLDMVKATKFIKDCGALLIGPNCPGIITPGEAKIGIMPGYIHKPFDGKGKAVGIISRSGTLTYEAVWQCTQRNIAQTTCVGIGGDPVKGLNYIELLTMYENDPQTDAMIMIGEIGGTDEEGAAAFVKENVKKPVISFIAGRTAPPGKRMGHAGAIISGGEGDAESKIKALEEAGYVIAETPSHLGVAMAKSMGLEPVTA